MYSVAEIKNINLDHVDVLRREWDVLLQQIIKNGILHTGILKRTYFSVEIDNLTDYFKDLTLQIKTVLNLDLSDIRIICLNYKDITSNSKDANIIHKDAPRQSAITIPIYAHDPVVFYYDNEIEFYKRDKAFKKPKLIYKYNYVNPVLLNVQQFHAWYITDENIPRVLIQLNLQEPFENIINRNLDKLNLK